MPPDQQAAILLLLLYEPPHERLDVLLVGAGQTKERARGDGATVKTDCQHGLRSGSWWGRMAPAPHMAAGVKSRARFRTFWVWAASLPFAALGYFICGLLFCPDIQGLHQQRASPVAAVVDAEDEVAFHKMPPSASRWTMSANPSPLASKRR